MTVGRGGLFADCLPALGFVDRSNGGGCAGCGLEKYSDTGNKERPPDSVIFGFGAFPISGSGSREDDMVILHQIAKVSINISVAGACIC
jgi:hypothetical protein